MNVSCHSPFLPGTSLEPAVIPTSQASSSHCSTFRIMCDVPSIAVYYYYYYYYGGSRKVYYPDGFQRVPARPASKGGNKVKLWEVKNV